MTSVPSNFLVEAASTLAIVASSNEPLLFLSGDLRVIAGSASFCQTFDIDAASLPGRLVSEIGSGEWAIPQLLSLLKATASGFAQIDVYEVNIVSQDNKPRCLLLNARRLDDGDKYRVRLLLAITDVTSARDEARQKDDLIREKSILLEELQHRVANSLQIIASVLMQSARSVQSDEARGHLQLAHHRVLSIAAVQRHLEMSSVGDVTLAPYLVQLCESLAASMIMGSGRLAIKVKVDHSVVAANVSVSIGLIVTELVINALKHAYPNNRSGVIRVDFRSEGHERSLTVTDDGVGMPSDPEKAKAGLGTGIVEALSKQLGGKISVSSGGPGTTVQIVFNKVVAKDVDARPAA
ncbi:histidine kinase [Hyphomicrobium methylovorum]|uniref:sensor histidine kinase n=1 Tax=Hyphomicrobium methylovorum TaxID=84 RepID=UPI0015E6B71D|nr:PAS domain-containing sensor histidine kinase [Hyphomicrobium methylovorum]MBA2126721.1 histidine kinase [Hyphomicrobium methylovorum]